MVSGLERERDGGSWAFICFCWRVLEDRRYRSRCFLL
jgi:hypothetical protein